MHREAYALSRSRHINLGKCHQADQDTLVNKTQMALSLWRYKKKRDDLTLTKEED